MFPERRPGATIAVIALLFALAYAAALALLAKPNGQIVLGDALEHYVQLRSAVFDRDLHFLNDYAGLYRVSEEELAGAAALKATSTGHIRNYMPVGPAILWAPSLFLVMTSVWMLNLAGVAYPLDGFARAFQASAGFSGIAAAAGGAWFAWRTAETLFDRRAAIWATLAVWLSSSTVYYSVISPAYSHAASMFAVGAFWLAWIRMIDRQDLRKYAVLGALAGVAALMRWQDALVLAVPALDALWHRREIGAAGPLLRVGVSASAAAVAFIPQMIVWGVLYGAPLTVPQGAGFLRWNEPALAAVLVSDNHGLLTWTPIVALALAGLVPLARKAPLVAAAASLVFATSWYVNAAVADWWAGEAFGARRFVSLFPIFVLGVAAIFDRWSARRICAVSAAFVGYTFLLLVQYQAFMHGLRDVVPYPRGAWGLWLARFRAPFDIAAAWLGQP